MTGDNWKFTTIIFVAFVVSMLKLWWQFLPFSFCRESRQLSVQKSLAVRILSSFWLSWSEIATISQRKVEVNSKTTETMFSGANSCLFINHKPVCSKSSHTDKASQSHLGFQASSMITTLLLANKISFPSKFVLFWLVLLCYSCPCISNAPHLQYFDTRICEQITEAV